MNIFAPKRIGIVTVAALIVLSITQLCFQFFGIEAAVFASRFALIALCLSLLHIFKFREWVLVGFAALAAIGLSQKQNGTADILFALDRAAFFAAFIYLVTLLKEAAQRSPSVLELGTYLTKQPSGKRYFSLAYGGHVMGVLLNFGAISLLTPLIQRGARAGGISSPQEKAAAAGLEQQQISALIRGFSWMILWSPTALTQAILFTSIPNVNLWITIPLGIICSIVMIFIGRVEDRFRWHAIDGEQVLRRQPYPQKAAKRFFTICALLIGATLFVAYLANVSGALALMLVAPIIMAAWVFEQSSDGQFGNTFKLATHSLAKILDQSSIVLGRSAITLAAAGFIGEAAARLAPVDLIAAQFETYAMPAWLLLISLPVIITLCGQVALSPILVVVFLSSILTQLPALPADPSMIVFSLGFGWALSMTASPNASATLLISGVTGIAPTTLTWRWNGKYALACYGVFAVSMIAIEKLSQ